VKKLLKGTQRTILRLQQKSVLSRIMSKNGRSQECFDAGGIRLRAGGFTLIEVLLSVLILSVGLIGVFRPLLASMSALEFIGNRSEASRLMIHLIWKHQEESRVLGEIVERLGQGELVGAESVYHYSLKAEPLSSRGRLYQVDYKISWHEGGRNKSLSRGAYLLLPVMDLIQKRS